MKNMTRAQRRRQAKIRKMLLSLSLVLVLAMAAVGGTIAWLTDVTDTVTNTFTVGNIDIILVENSGPQYKMIPGSTLEKNPTVHVEAGSEPCYLFVKVEETGGDVTVGETTYNFDAFVTYAIAQGWTELPSVPGVYYRSNAVSPNAYSVLAGDQVTIKDTVTKQMMDELEKDSTKQPKLTFTAYAVQLDNIPNAQVAWQKIDPSYVIPTT